MKDGLSACEAHHLSSRRSTVILEWVRSANMIRASQGGRALAKSPRGLK
jgi:hypothetical protein